VARVRMLKVIDAPAVHAGRSAHHAMNLITLVEEKFGQVRTILAGDARDQCCFRHVVVKFMVWSARP
jgi:hypothetical protein